MASLIVDLPVGTQFYFSGCQVVVGPKFKGIKSIPQGYHLLSHSDNLDSSSTPSTTSEANPIQGIRSGIIRYFEKDQVVLRKWEQSIQLIQPITNNSEIHSFNSEQLQSHLPFLAPYPIQDPTHSTEGSFKLDPIKNWSKATASLNSLGSKHSRKLLSRILGSASKETGFDLSSGDGRFDSLSEIWAPEEFMEVEAKEKEREDEAEAANNVPKLDPQGRPYWGVARPQSELSSNGTHSERAENEDGRPVGSLRFTDFDLKRSWPKECTGEERTRWSVDKSWLLQNVMERSGGPSYLLAEMELAFLIFISCHNPNVLDHFNSLIFLFSQSAEIMGSPSSFKLHPAALASILDSNSSLDSFTADSSSEETHIRVTPSLHASFMRVLTSLFNLLPSDFWSSQNLDPETSKIERKIKTELSGVRRNIGSALSLKASRDRNFNQEVEEDDTLTSAVQRRSKNKSRGNQWTMPNIKSNISEGKEDLLSQELTSLIPAWRSLSHLCSSRFGWNLDQKLDEEVEAKEESSVIRARGRRDEGDEGMEEVGRDESEEDESEEDLPVVVDLDEERRGWL